MIQITPDQADAIIRNKWATTCTNNCNVGRACDCTADLGDEYDRPPMTRADGLLSLLLILACWGVVAAVALAVGWL